MLYWIWFSWQPQQVDNTTRAFEEYKDTPKGAYAYVYPTHCKHKAESEKVLLGNNREKSFIRKLLCLGNPEGKFILGLEIGEYYSYSRPWEYNAE
jgi:hypothetical protein